MTRVLELSILALFLATFSWAKVGTSASRGSKTNPKTQKAATSSKPTVAMGFWEEAEDIEREAWWVLTNERLEGSGSPFRVLRAAYLTQAPQVKTKLRFRFCQKLKWIEVSPTIWRVESECRKPAQDVGRIEKLNEKQWRVEWRTDVFQDHFGLGASILYPKMSCEIQLLPNGRISEMRCADYSRNRNLEEIVVLRTFEYEAGKQSMLRLNGEVKKDLQVVSTIETEVPLSGDVLVKETVIPQKTVEGQTDFSDSVKPKVKKNPEVENGQKENNKENNKENANNEEVQNQNNQEVRQEGEWQNGQEVGQGVEPQNEIPKALDPDALPQERVQEQHPDELPPPIESSRTGR